MKLRAHSARAAAIRVRAIRAGYQNFDLVMRRLDRIERIGKQLRSPTVVDLIIGVRKAVIEACAPLGPQPLKGWNAAIGGQAEPGR